MPFPNYPDKHTSEPLFTAADRLAGRAPRFAPPHTVLFCYHPGLLKHAVKKQRGKSADGFFGDFYRLRKTKNRVGILGNFGVGAPVTAVLLEDLAAFGVRRCVIAGLAGGLQEGLHTGAWVLAERAIRDEGTSHHYLPAARYAFPSAGLTGQLRAALQASGEHVAGGPTWTTDAPYRETAAELRAYQQAGVLSVEMEAAALFAVGRHLGVETAAVFTIADTIAGGRWQPASDQRRAEQRLKRLFDTLIQSLQA